MKDKMFLALLETSVAHANKSREGFQNLDLSEGQPKILYILAYGEGCSQKELARKCQVRQSTLTVMLKKLENKGFINKEKIMVSSGKRAYAINLTDNGRKMAEKVVELVEQLEERGLKGFTKQEREQLLLMLGRVAENLL